MLFKGYRIPLFSSLIIWAVLWEIVGHTEYGLILPPLTKIFERIIEIVPTPSFATALFITGKAFLLGNLIAIGVGVPMGVLMGRVKIADSLILPWVNVANNLRLNDFRHSAWPAVQQDNAIRNVNGFFNAVGDKNEGFLLIFHQAEHVFLKFTAGLFINS